MRKAVPTLLVAVGLAVAALAMAWGPLGDPVEWTPDGLFYQARSLEIRGMDRDQALQQAFQGPLGAELRHRDPSRSGDPAWVSYNAKFYERRIAVPLVAAALEPATGDRAILDISVAGYVAAILALFALLLMRFRLPIAAAVAALTVFLPALTHHAGFPLTDSWGLALEIAALVAGLLVLERGPRWLIAWVACILLLSLTRDNVWVPILAAVGLSLTQRSRESFLLVGTGLVAVLPVMALFSVPVRELMAMMLNGIQPTPDASWSFIAERYPGAFADLLRANGGYVRDGAWYSAAYLAGGLALLFLIGRGGRRTATDTFLQAGALAGVALLLIVPVFSAFRLELVVVPMAAFGLAHGLERVAEGATRVRWARAPGLRGNRARA